MNIVKITTLTVLTILFLTSASDAGWLIYYEPEFKGTILDIETKQPIEGAVVVAQYKRASWWLSPESVSSIVNVRETLTDKDGNFRIPSYTTLIQPFSWQIPSMLIIFKPGYASLVIGPWHFIGKETREQDVLWSWSKDLQYKLHGRGIVELPKVRTKEERRSAEQEASMYGPFGADVKPSDLPLFYKMLQEERKGGF